jgi:hypothetical protein
MRIKEMTVAKWIAVKDNPIQRDTERHAARAKHLLNPKDTHAAVSAAELPDGTLIKLDGHTRALLWARNQVTPPAAVTVTIYPVKNLAGAEDLYKTFDAKEAMETMADKITGGYHRAGFKPESTYLSSAQITNALRIAWRGLHATSVDDVVKVEVYDIIEEFLPELVQFDTFSVTNHANGKIKIPGAVFGAFLLSYRMATASWRSGVPIWPRPDRRWVARKTGFSFSMNWSFPAERSSPMEVQQLMTFVRGRSTVSISGRMMSLSQVSRNP